MPYSFGDVVLIRFPFTNQLSSKQRPAVVVSNLGYNNIMPDLVLMAITSQLKTTGLGDLILTDWHRANLLKPSAIKPIVATIEQGLIIRQLGALESNDQSKLRAAIAAILG